MNFLDPVAIAQLDSMPLRARAIVEGALSGMHRASLHGSSVEFAEHKEYSPGDDIRHIDWHAYGKLDRYYIKQFEQESELTAFLVLDATGSMEYRGDGVGKLEYASYLLGALAYLLIKQRDKVGLLVFGDDAVSHYIPPRARPTHLHDLLDLLETVNRRGPSGAAPLAATLERVAELARSRRSLIVLASDLFDDSDGLGLLRRLRARRHDVVLFQTLDPHELSLPFEGLTLFESMEREHQLLVDPGSVRKRYRRELNRFLAKVRRECVSGGVEHHLVSTAQPLSRTLLDFLTMRTRSGAERPWNS